MLKNSKYLILSIIFFVVIVITLFLIYIHNVIWIKTDLSEQSTLINNKTQTWIEFKHYNAVLRSNLFLLITNDDSFYSSDSIQLRVKYAEAGLDSIIKNSDLIADNPESLIMLQTQDSLSKVRKIILELYFSGNTALAKKSFVEQYNSTFLRSDVLCDEFIFSAVSEGTDLHKDAEFVKVILMRIIIILIVVLIIAFIGIYSITYQVEKKRIFQQVEINKLQMQNEISEKVNHEQKRLNAAIMAAGFGVIDWKMDNLIPDVNDKWLSLLDIERSDFEKKGIKFILEKINQSQINSMSELMNMLRFSNKSEFKNEIEINHSQLGKIWLESIDYIIDKDNSGVPKHLIGFLHDITDRKLAEIKLKESYQIVKTAGQVGKIGYWEYDISKDKPQVSDEWLDLFSVTREQYENGNYSEWIANMKDSSQGRAIQNHREIVSGLRSKFCTEYEYNHPLRGDIWIEGLGQVTEYDQHDNVKKYVGYHQDITHRKQAEIKATQNALELKSWYENMNMAFCVCNMIEDAVLKTSDFKYTFVNNEFCNLLNLSAINLINRRASELINRDMSESIVSNIENIFAFGAVKFEVFDAFLNKHLEVSAFTIGDHRFAMLFSDITERYNLQQKIVEEQKYYRRLFEMSRDAIFLINAHDLSFIDANEACVELFGAVKKADLMMINYSLLHPAKQINGQASKALIKFAVKNADIALDENYEWLFRKITGQEFIGQIKFSVVDYGNTKAVLGIVRDVTKIQNAYDNLERTRGWLQTIIDSVNSIIVVKDNLGRILASNETYNKTFGQSKESVIGRYVEEIYLPDEAKAIKSIDDEIILLGLTRTYEQKLTTTDGKQHIFLVTKTPLKDAQKNVYAIVVQGTDITTIKNLEEKLRDASQKAVSANRAKSGFLANMSHEIRTPMNSIIGFAEILQRKMQVPEHKEYVKSILSAGNTLLSLINDILDLSKIEAGKTVLKPVYFSPFSLKSAIIDIFSHKVNEKELELIFDINTKDGILLLLDENRLRQIMINITGNAVKFTKKGFVKIDFNITKNIAKTCNIIISIEDTGPGIPEDELNEIFNPFTQSQNLDTTEYGGTGLGLSICNQLVGLMNGKISVVSNLGKGSCFTIEINDVKFEDSGEVDVKMPDVFVDYVFAPARILITDDIKSNIDVLVNHLSEYNFNITEASNGAETIEKVSELKPDILILDLRLPDIGGREVASKIRTMPDCENIKIIAYTAASGIVLENGVLNSDFDAMILKPATRDSIMSEIKKFVSYEEIRTDDSVVSDIFAFTDEVSLLMAEMVFNNVGIPDERLTNRQINTLISKIKETELYKQDDELKRFINILAKAAEDFNIVLAERLSGEIIIQFNKYRNRFS